MITSINFSQDLFATEHTEFTEKKQNLRSKSFLCVLCDLCG